MGGSRSLMSCNVVCSAAEESDATSHSAVKLRGSFSPLCLWLEPGCFRNPPGVMSGAKEMPFRALGHRPTDAEEMMKLTSLELVNASFLEQKEL